MFAEENEEAPEQAINIYMIFAEDGEDWFIGLMGIPVGTEIAVVHAYAEKKISEDEKYPKSVKLKAVVPFDMVAESVMDFADKLDKMGVTSCDPS